MIFAYFYFFKSFEMRLVLFLLFTSFWAYGQRLPKLLERGDELRRSLSFAAAVDVYEKIIVEESALRTEEKKALRYGLADAYYQLRQYSQAESVLAPLMAESMDKEIIKRYAQLLASLSRYDESARFWKKYEEIAQAPAVVADPQVLSRNQDSYSIEYLGINSGMPEFSPIYYKEGLVFVSARKSTRSIKRIFTWDDSHFLDLYYVEERALKRKEESGAAVLGKGGDNSYSGKELPLGKDYYTPATANDANTIAHTREEYIPPAIKAIPFSKSLNSKYHEGPSVIYSKGTRIIFTRNATKNSWKKSGDIVRLKLFSAERIGKEWRNIKELSFNSEQYSSGHPAISEDGKLLFFVSDMPGGYGGTDLYYTVFSKGAWGKPVNAGPTVNTSGDELFPFWDQSGKLYFSSNGHPGLGALDLFVVDWDVQNSTVKGAVRNLGAPLNSPYDDFGLVTDKDREKGYFSSNRKRGGSDDDIYRFTRTGPQFGCRELVIKTETAGKVLGEVSVKVGFRWELTDALGEVHTCVGTDTEFTIELQKTGYRSQSVKFSNVNAPDMGKDTLVVSLESLQIEEGKLVQHWDAGKYRDFAVWVTDGQGKPLSGVQVRLFSTCIPKVQEGISDLEGKVVLKRDPECSYELISSKDGYTLSRDLLEKEVKVASSPARVEIHRSKLYKVGEVIRVENIYYENEEYKLSTNAKSELKKWAEDLIKYPNMYVEVSSHTDTRGNAAVNLRISELRAKEVKAYLSKFLGAHRILAVGKGETEPVNSCSDGVQCSETEHARNRRTEFRIVKMEKSLQ